MGPVDDTDVLVGTASDFSAGVALKRKAGEWHPLFQVIATVAFPLIYAVYLGVAESAREIAVEIARRTPPTPHALSLAGRMDTSLRAAQLAHAATVEVVGRNEPLAESVNEVMIGRSLVAEHAIRAVGLEARYGEPTLIRPRLGQGAFRVLVTDAYHRRCAITGE